MPEQPDTPTPPAEAPPAEPGGKEKKKKKKSEKVRSAWISFTGRIVAQVLGAVASVLLALFVLHKYQSDSGTSGGNTRSEPVAARVAARQPGEVALAVLPLQNLSGDPRQEYFADGMTEALITDLAHIEGLHVISRTSSMHYKGQNKSLPEISRALGVDWIIEGSVQKSGERVRVTAQLIDTRTDRHAWARSYDRTMRDVLTMQAEVATAIASEVQVALTPQRQTRLAQRRSVDPAVYDIYLQGRQAMARWSTAGFQQAIGYFEQAVKKDPNFALAQAGISDAYSLLGTSGYATPEIPDAMTRAKAAAERALALDDSLAEVHTALGRVLHLHDWDWSAAERAFRRALALNPGYSTAHHWYATLLSEQARDAEAVSEAQRAVALDPLSANKHVTLGGVHYNARRFDLAIQAVRRAQELDANTLAPTLILAACSLSQGKPRAAIEACERAPGAAARHPLVLAMLAAAYVRAGEANRATAIRQELLANPKVPAAALVRLYAATGDHDALFAALDRAVEERSDIIPRLRVWPLVDGARSDRRFAGLLKRVGL